MVVRERGTAVARDDSGAPAGRIERSARRRAPSGVRALALAALLLLPGAVPARAVTQEGQAWFLGSARLTLPARFKLWLEVQPRIGGDGMSQLLLRPAIGYQFAPWWAFYQGYGWTPSFDPFTSENRSYQESLFDNALGDLRIVNRTRFEQRFIEDVDDVSLRLRHMLRLTYPLDRARRWFAAISDEPFVTCNDADGGPRSGFDQNRFYAGVRRQLTSSLAVEVGYLHQYVNRSANDDLSRNNAFVWLDLTY